MYVTIWLLISLVEAVVLGAGTTLIAALNSGAAFAPNKG